MKITCQSCQSKYNVADDKVTGKIVKIRCRKCGATIVVNGTGGTATNGSTENGATGGGEWHVNVTDTDQRTMSLAELVEAHGSGLVTHETFIWTDGMDDWKPLAEVEAVANALRSQNAGAGAIELGASADDSGQDAFPALDPKAPAYEPPPATAAPAAAAEPKRAAVQRREARGRDLFATNAGEEVQTSAPIVTSGMASTGDNGLTGQRNENSVLFSLAVLTKDADDRPAAAAQENRSTASKEDSGLIDLKALAARADSMHPGAPRADVFSAPIGLTPPLGAPLGALGSIAPEAQPKSKLPLIIGGAGGVVVLLVLGIMLGMKLGGSAAPPPALSAQATASAAPSVTASAEPSATGSAAASASVDTSASAAPSASVAVVKPKPAGGGGYHGPAPAKPGGPTAAGGATGGSTPAPAPAPPPKKNDCGCNGDLMCMMKCSTH